MKKSGFTLIELMLTTVIVAGVVIGLFSIFSTSITLTDMAGTMTQMSNAIRYKMDALYDINDFASVDTLDGQTFDLTGFGFESIAVSEAKGVYEVNTINTNLKRVTISISYAIRDGRVVGEDLNLNGILDDGEDLNSDARLSSPVEATTIISRKPA